MRREQKKQVQEFVELLGQAHEEIKKQIEKKNPAAAMDLLAQCQEGAIQMGSLIEATEGDGAPTIQLLESYCELVYGIYGELGQETGGRIETGAGEPADEDGSIQGGTGSVLADAADRQPPVQAAGKSLANGGKAYKKLRSALLRIESSIRHDIKVRLEVAFFPYKASMWDSLESVWLAADADPDCDAYVVPIPYYDRNRDGTLGAWHYEGNDFPPYVPVTYYETYRLEERRPDAAYIHNPYDQGNYVTTVDPRFYSAELKKYIDKLVYIPYYTTTGGMAEAQERCLAYYYADYIVIQAEKYRKFFAPELADEKFLPFGSPKFDRAIRMCAQPGPVPESWAERMRGRKVYFYNTSINGLLGDTARFLEKMAYVFRCFQGREDACLMWRPHPLLESTMDSLRPEYRPAYDELKRMFTEMRLGIYDDTPDITETISHCDAYLGDEATSVTSLFGIAGKPLFIFNNNINTAPEEDDWRGEIVRGFQIDGQDRWTITQGNKLYRSSENDYHYRFYCDLSEYAAAGYYIRALEIDGKVYVCPGNAQDILVVGEGKVQRRIPLEHQLEQYGAFSMAWNIGQYLFLVPMRYPDIVRYDTVRDKVDYINGGNEVFVDYTDGKWRVGGSCVWGEYLLLASPVDNRILAIHSESGKAGLLTTEVEDSGGCIAMAYDGTDMWLLPYSGTKITRWNPGNGKAEVYADVPEGFFCRELPRGYETGERPFSQAAFSGKYVFLSPYWGNMFLRLDRETGEMREWKPPFPALDREKNGYFLAGAKGNFLPYYAIGGSGGNGAAPMGSPLHCEPEDGSGTGMGTQWDCRYFSVLDRKFYDVRLETGECREVSVDFDTKELRAQTDGFWEQSEWLQYACKEDAFNCLTDFLDGNVSGAAFDRERQLRAYEKIAANYDGTCGEKVHRFVKDVLTSDEICRNFPGTFRS